MKALTIRQPWAWAICYAGKDVENRTWRYPRALDGQRIAIHAGRSFSEDGLYELLKRRRAGHLSVHPGNEVPRLRETGIVATAVLAGYAGKQLVPWGWYEGNGLYGWVLRDVIVLPEPVPCRGAQGFWEVPADVLARVTP